MGRTRDPHATDPAKSEAGQTLVEYGMIVGVLSVALIVVLATGGLGGALNTYYLDITDMVSKASP